MMWFKSWLAESSSIGPKCSDGTYVKGMPFTRDDCFNAPLTNDDMKSCVTHENEALLPNLGPSQVFSSLEKIKDYTTQIKNNYHINKLNNVNRPSPEESEYFYDEYVDYPINDTVIDGLKNEVDLIQNSNKTQITVTVKPVISVGTKNTSKNSAINKAPSSGFTFFGMPLPAIDMGKILNTGRKVDWPPTGKNSNKYQSEPPKFETGGFSPMLPTTASGFKPIPNPAVNLTHKLTMSQGGGNYSIKGGGEGTIAVVSTKPPMKTVQSNITHQKMKSEIHELQAYVDDDNSTHVAYNRTKNVEEQKTDPNKMQKYNMMESNLTITQVTEKDGILITTDTSHDMSLQAWMESSTMSYSSTVTSKPPIKKHVNENQPTALSAVLIPNNEELARRNYSRPATITKVNMPFVEHHDLRDSYSPVINREAKTRFNEHSNTGSTKTRQVDDKDWYYKNYNNSNLEPYVAPGVHTSSSNVISFKNPVMLLAVHMLLHMLLVSKLRM